MAAFAAIAAAGCAQSPRPSGSPVTPTPPTPASAAVAVAAPAAAPTVSRAAQLVVLVESFQPRDPAGPPPNRWSEIVRTAFLYAGALKAFAADSAVVSAWTVAEPGSPVNAQRVGSDFILASLGDLADPTGALATESRRFLDLLENQDLFLHLHQISEPCRLVAPPPFEGINASLTFQDTFEQGALKNLAIPCCARMSFAADDTDPERFVRSFESGMRLGHAACARPMMLSLINAHATQNRVMLQALRAVLAGKLGTDTCRRLAEALERTRLPSPVVFVEMERVIGLDTIERYFERHAREQARTAEGVASTADLSLSEAETAYNTSIDRAIALLRDEVPTLGPATRAADDGAPEGERAERVGQGPGQFAPTMPVGRDDPDGLLHSLMPPIGQLCVSEQEHRCLRAALATALLIEEHRAARGELPRTLVELSLEPGEALPPDPCDPARPLGYRPPAGPTAMKGPGGYVLYSVGADRTDNNGAPSPVRRRNALIPQPRWEGTDFVIIGSDGP